MDALRSSRPAGPTHPFGSGTTLRGVRHAEVGEVGQQVVVRLEAGRGDLAVGQPGKAQAVDVIGEHAPVGVGGGLGAVVVQDVGQHLQGGRPGRLGRVAAGVFQDGRQRPQVVGHVVGRLPGVEQVLLAVGVDDRVDGRVAAAVQLLQSAVVAAPADRGPDADHRAAEHFAGHFQRDGVDVVAGEVVVPGPGESVLGALDVGEERVAAQPGGQPDPVYLHGLGHAVEADRDVRGEYLADGPGLAGLGSGGVPGGPGLPAVLVLGEYEGERDVGQVVAVVVDVDPVHRAGVELRPGGGRGDRGRGAGRV